MSIISNYNYDAQLRSYLVQFCAVFAGLEVEVGKRDEIEPHLIRVPIKSASVDRVVASIKGENTQNQPIRVPIMSAYLASLDQYPEQRKGVGAVRRQAYVPVGGLVPDDIKVVEQRMPVPYRATYELSIWTSNTYQRDQILEQLLSIFNPTLQLQTSDDVFDWTRITDIELLDIRLEENIPAGTDRRLILSTLTFACPVRLSVPADVHTRFIQDVYVRLGVVGTDVNTAADAIADLDLQGIEYEQIFSAEDDLTFD